MTDSVFFPYVIKEGVLRGIKPYLCQTMNDIINDRRGSTLTKDLAKALSENAESKAMLEEIFKNITEQFKEIAKPTNKLYEETFKNAFYGTFYKNKHIIIDMKKKLEAEIEEAKKTKGGEEMVEAEASFPDESLVMAEVVQKAIPIDESAPSGDLIEKKQRSGGSHRRAYKKTRRALRQKRRRTKTYQIY